MKNPPCGALSHGFSADPEMLVMLRSFPRRAQHQFIQLAIDELELDGEAERKGDIFLASSAWLIEDGDELRADELYPRGCAHSQTWLRHKIRCAEAVAYFERLALGRTAMRKPQGHVPAPSSAK